MDTQLQIERLVELALIQRTELKQLVEQLPQLRQYLSDEIEKNLEVIEPQLRSELEEFTKKKSGEFAESIETNLTEKIDELLRNLERTTAAKYSVLLAERDKTKEFEQHAKERIAEAALEIPSKVKAIVADELSRFPRAGEIDQLRKEFAEPKGLNPRGKWQPDTAYQKLDLVALNGDSYVSNVDDNRERPARSSAAWTLSAARGVGGGGGGISSIVDLYNKPHVGEVLIGNGVDYVNNTLTAGDGITISNGAGSITIAATAGGVTYQGTWDAATNNPTLTSSVGTKGYYYVVSVAGSTNLNGVTDWNVGDWAVFNGSVWQKIDNTDSVTSVFGRNGVITAVAGDYTAAKITNTPSGNIAATDVQSALNEIDGEKLAKASNLSDLASVTTSRTNLGLGSLATQNGTFSGTSSGTNTGDQTISITGDVTASGSTGTLTATVTKINNTSLAGLVTGILKNTTGTGVPSIAVAADFPTLNQNTTGNAATASAVAVTGITGLGTGVSSFLQTPTSSNLSSMVTDETGTGNLVFSNSPTLVTPALGTPTALTLTNATGLPLATGVSGTLPVANGGTGVTTSTGTGSVVLSASPTLTGTPLAPTASAGTSTTQIATTAYVQANRGDKYLTTSSSTNTIDNGTGKSFTCDANLAYIATQAVTIVYDVNNHMHATVQSYNSTTGVMVVDVDSHSGSGTYSSWTINLGGLTSAAGALLSANNLSDVASASTSRSNLGVTATGADTTYAYRANNLSDLSSASSARTNLGLGTMATQNSSSVSISGGTLASVTLTTPTISSIVNTGTLTLPNQTDTLVGRATTDTLTNKTLTSPIMTTPTLGVASATSVNKVAFTAPATSATLTIADGATLTASANATVSGTNTGDQTISISGDVTASGSTGTLSATVTKINGTSMAGLATGILKNTTTTGVPSIAVAADFPTLNQNTTGSAATLTTARAIYGNNFDGSAALTQIIASTYGGTGNGFTKFSGPATSEKTFTLPNSNATLLYEGGAIGATTPSTVSATTLSATTLAVNSGTTANSAYFNSTATNGGYISLQNSGTVNLYIGAYKALLGSGNATDSTILTSGATLALGVSSGTYLPLSLTSSGAAITGTLSATGTVTATVAGYAFIANRTSNPGSIAWQNNSVLMGQINAAASEGLDFYTGATPTLRMALSSTGLAVTGTGNGAVTATGGLTLKRTANTSRILDITMENGYAQYAITSAGSGYYHRFEIDGTAYATISSTGLTVGGTTGLSMLYGTTIYGANASISLPMLKFSQMGYSSSYGTTIVGTASGNNTVCISVDPVSNTSGSFNGNGSEVLFRNSIQFRTPNSANTGYIDFLVLDASANVRIPTNLTVTGSLSKGSGSFRIDHPLPAKKETHQLVHSFIEGPKADLIYRGKIDLVDGKAAVNIDTAATMTEGTFEVLCRDVQCFTTNETGWTPVRGKVTGNILTIEAQDASCTDSISWMVVGERCDPHMMETEWTDDNGRVIVEPLKPVETEVTPKE